MRIKNTMIFKTSHGITEISKYITRYNQTIYSNFHNIISFHIRKFCWSILNVT